MFNDLKKAFEKVQDSLQTQAGIIGYVIDEKSWDELEQEFNICFVEPEDDEEHQLWVENDDVI